MFCFVCLILRSGKGMQITRCGISTSHISGTIALCVEKYQCERWDQNTVGFIKINEQTTVK